MPAPKGNKNAQRAEERASMTIQFRVTPREKKMLKKAAQPGKLSTYIRGKLGLKYKKEGR